MGSFSIQFIREYRVEFSVLFSSPYCACTQSHLIICDPLDCIPPGSTVHGISSGKNTGISCNFFFQGTFLTQGSNLNLLHWQVDSLPLSIGEAPRSLFVIYNILHTIVCVCQSQSPSLSLPTPYPAGNHKFVYYICDSISVL